MKVNFTSDQLQNLLAILTEARDEYENDARAARNGSRTKAHWDQRARQCAEIEEILLRVLKITPIKLKGT